MPHETKLKKAEESCDEKKVAQKTAQLFTRLKIASMKLNLINSNRILQAKKKK